jgi:head-tail adaptor
MKAPLLNRKLTLQEAQRAADGAGGYVLEWVDLGALWADVRAGSGRERAGDTLTLATMPYRITVRAAPLNSPRRPRPEQRFRDGARLFRILAVGELDARGQYLVCFAQEEVVA